MYENPKVIMNLKKAANYSKLAMHELGPRSYKKGQGALLKVVYRFGNEGTLSKDEAKKVLNWRGKEVRAIAKKAADNGYITISDPKEGFFMTLTELGTEVIKKRFAAEDKAAEAVLAGLTDAEKETLLQLTQKISDNCKGLGVDYSKIRKHTGKSCHRHDKSHGRRGGRGAQNVFVFKGDCGSSCK